MKPPQKIECLEDEVQYQLVNGDTSVNWHDLDGTLAFVSSEYDVADFRLVNLIRLLYESGDRVPADYRKKIDDVLLNFRYWWDEPGENSMCYWSENHQILFASAEYLVGQLYPHTVFPNSGLTGNQHMEKSRKRILDWLEMRWKYGFVEFNSGVYYKEDIGGLINLIDFAEDEELYKKCVIIMDLLFYDVAVQSIHNMFVSTSGRAYWNNRTGVSSTLGGLTNYYWGDGKPINPHMMYGLMTTERYQMPPVFDEIAKDSTSVIIKQSNGLDIADLKKEGYYGTDNRSMMMQWAMEAFTNPEIIRNSLSTIRNHLSFNNEFIAEFKTLDYTLVRWLHLEPIIARIINPQANGAAIQQGNTYTYKTTDYSMYTAQNHHPGTYATQQHVFGMNIRNHFAIFHMHPALKKGVIYQSPSYEVGYGHFPHAVQDKNVGLAIYSLPDEKGMMEMDLLNFTRAYFPTQKFDTAFVDGNYVFGKKGNTYCAMIGATDLHYAANATDDLIQEGKQTCWITEAGSLSEDGSFESFINRIQQNKVSFNREKLQLHYESNNNTYDLTYKADFMVNGQVVDTKYDRYDSPYITAERKAQTLTFKHNGKSLFLDFERMERVFD